MASIYKLYQCSRYGSTTGQSPFNLQHHYTVIFYFLFWYGSTTEQSPFNLQHHYTVKCSNRSHKYYIKLHWEEKRKRRGKKKIHTQLLWYSHGNAGNTCTIKTGRKNWEEDSWKTATSTIKTGRSLVFCTHILAMVTSKKKKPPSVYNWFIFLSKFLVSFYKHNFWAWKKLENTVIHYWLWIIPRTWLKFYLQNIIQVDLDQLAAKEADHSRLLVILMRPLVRIN